MINLGEVVRQRHGRDGVVLVGFGGHDGMVSPAADGEPRWNAMPVPALAAGHHEALIHEVTIDPALIVSRPPGHAMARARRGHRAIGVAPRVRRAPHLGATVIGQRYDAFISLGRTESLHAFHLDSPSESSEQDTNPWNA